MARSSYRVKRFVKTTASIRNYITYLTSLRRKPSESEDVSPLIPGPLSAVSSDRLVSSFTTAFDLATPNIVACVAGVCSVDTITLSATHGGEALTHVFTACGPRTDGNWNFVTWFFGTGLTLETANLVITSTGGQFGPAFIVCNDDFGEGDIDVEFVGAYSGFGKTTSELTYTGEAEGILLHGWVGEKGTLPSAYPDGLSRVSGYVSGGEDGLTLTNPTVTGTGWTGSGEEWEHAAGASGTLSYTLSPTAQGPLAYDLDVTIPAGAKLAVGWVTSDSRYTTRNFTGPIDGVINDLLEPASSVWGRVTLQTTGAVEIRSFKTLNNPLSAIGNIGRTEGKTVYYSGVYSTEYTVSALYVIPA